MEKSKLMIYLPDVVFKQTKVLCALEGINVSKKVEELLKEWIREQKKKYIFLKEIGHESDDEDANP